jgi:hypothetical protein
MYNKIFDNNKRFRRQWVRRGKGKEEERKVQG